MIRTAGYREPGSDCDFIEGPTGKEIKRLETTFLEPKLQHNSATLVAKLPPEVLSYVFELVASADRPHPNEIYRHKWLNISHICSHWRQVALDSTNLWRRITLNAPSWWVEDLLSRSKDASLSVEVDLQYPCIRDLTPVWAHIPRICHLSISAPQSHIYVGYLLPDLSTVANLLESLTVRLTGNAAVSTRLRTNFFAGGAPRLRQLQLHNCDLVWDSPFLSDLTSLILVSTSKIPSMPELVASFQNMPNLKVLYLDGNLPLLSDTTGPFIHERTPLQCLSELTIRDARVVDGLHILDQFTFPSLLTLELNLEGMRDASDLARLKTIISRLFNDEGFGSRCPIRRLNASCYAPELAELEAWDTESDSSEVEDFHKTPRFLLGLTLPRQLRADTFQSLIRILPLENLEGLSVHNIDNVDWSLFGQLVSLQRLSVNNYASDASLTQAFATKIQSARQEPPGGREDHPSMLYFPSLKTLTLLGWADQAGNTCLDRLIHAMVKRRKSQMPTPKITLDVRKISADQEKRLREVVNTLVVENRSDYRYF